MSIFSFAKMTIFHTHREKQQHTHTCRRKLKKKRKKKTSAWKISNTKKISEEIKNIFFLTSRVYYFFYS